jgi:hypothetical protein
VKTAYGLFCVAFCLFLAAPRSEAASICGANPTNLVANCGFETGSFSGWILTGNDTPLELGNLYGVEGLDPVDGISPNSGNYQAYVADLRSNATTLSQTLTTSVGVEYEVSWYLAQDTAVQLPNYSNAFSASFGGTTLVSLSAVPIEGYTYYSYFATATSSSTVLSLTLGNDLGEFLLDDVSASRVPEPASWMLAPGGAALLFVLHRRRPARTV